MKTLYNSICESLDTLYHFTNGQNIVNILKKDKFMASEDDGHNPKDYPYYISTTRTPYAQMGYPTKLMGGDVVRIVMDGSKLKSKFKIIPINWMTGSKNLAIKSSWKNRDGSYNDAWKEYSKTQGEVEAEERILLKQSTINNISKYINNESIKPKDAEDIIRLADKLGIEVRIPFTTKEFNYLK